MSIEVKAEELDSEDFDKTVAFFLEDLKPQQNSQTFLKLLKSSGALKVMMTGALKYGYACAKNDMPYEEAKRTLHQTLSSVIEEKLKV